MIGGSGVWTRANLVTGSDADHWARLVHNSAQF